MSNTFLTKEEMAEFTGVKSKARQIQHLRSLGVLFWINALGFPVMARCIVEGRNGRVDSHESERVKVTSPVFSMNEEELAAYNAKCRADRRKAR